MAVVPSALAPYVTSVAAYDVDTGAPGVHRGLPGTALTLVLPVSAPLEISWPDRPGSRRRSWSSVAGLHTRPAAIHHPGRQSGVQVELTPAGSRVLLGVSAAELADEVVTLEEVGPRLGRLTERLADAPATRHDDVVVDALLSELVTGHHAPSRPDVERALVLLGRGERVAQVADEVGLSRRRLSTLVREECGLTPQGYRRVARFARSRRLIGRRPLVEVAAACHYADQGHLAREWSELAGCSPTTWLREEFPFVPDRDGGGDQG